ncbi:FKBP-type peptidyl-prolyl cis-trans isomerase SlyD [bioreactor metagenome]|uniref:peptidylprolyl isomerase n=1 Tax=bioreactor metagenome TaxID=1076179 RepID=A0A645FXF0_9ZZZZ
MTVQQGNTVTLHYKGTLVDGTLFDESYGSEPLEFMIGSGVVIPKFEEAIIGMQVGEKKNIFIVAEDAYGKRTDELILEIPKENIPDDVTLEVGDTMQLQLDPDYNVAVEVIEIKEDVVVFDANHQLADQDLNFEIELIDIK